MTTCRGELEPKADAGAKHKCNENSMLEFLDRRNGPITSHRRQNIGSIRPVIPAEAGIQ
jgi:hypothetical protein